MSETTLSMLFPCQCQGCRNLRAFNAAESEITTLQWRLDRALEDNARLGGDLAKAAAENTQLKADLAKALEDLGQMRAWLYGPNAH